MRSLAAAPPALANVYVPTRRLRYVYVTKPTTGRRHRQDIRPPVSPSRLVPRRRGIIWRLAAPV
jgi:hypothetical protein